MTDPDDMDAAGGTPKPRWLTPGVGAVAGASFFSDSGHEMTTSVLRAFLTGTLGAAAAALRVIDGISDALIGVMKLLGGPGANDPQRRAHMASGGYLGTAAATGAAVTVWQVGALRAIAWLSRGLRFPARDALLASLSPPTMRGRAFGLERAGDNLGAIAVALAFALTGAGIGLAEPTQSAAVAQLLPDRLRGSGFGVLGAVQATGDVVATIVAGMLYTVFSAAVTFGYAAASMVAATVTSGTLRRSVNETARGACSRHPKSAPHPRRRPSRDAEESPE